MNPTIDLPVEDDPFSYQPCSPRNVYFNNVGRSPFHTQPIGFDGYHYSPLLKQAAAQPFKARQEQDVQHVLDGISNHMFQTNMQNTEMLFSQLQI